MGQPALTNMGGMMTANVPDVCKVPTPSGSPVPTPFPNMSQGTMLNPGTLTKKVKVAKAPAAMLSSKTTLSNGDEPGVALGVVSGKIMGPAEFINGSMKVRLEGKAAIRLGDPTKQNQGNTTGAVVAPSQAIVLMG